jgi:hypothetical protein
VLIDWEYLCDGIYWVPTKEEWETPRSQQFYLEKVQRPGKPPIPRPWPERLSEQLLRDLKAWNDSWGSGNPPVTGDAARVLQERGKKLAIRAQNELGTDEWEVLYHLGDRVHRVHPPGTWPAETWEPELLGYRPIDPRETAEEELRVIEALRTEQQQDQRKLDAEEARIRAWLRENQQETGEDCSAPSDL